MYLPRAVYAQINPWVVSLGGLVLSWVIWGVGFGAGEVVWRDFALGTFHPVVWLGYFAPVLVTCLASFWVSKHLPRELLKTSWRLPLNSLGYLYVLASPFAVTLLILSIAMRQILPWLNLLFGLVTFPGYALLAALVSGLVGFEFGVRAVLRPHLDARIDSPFVVDALLTLLWLGFVWPQLLAQAAVWGLGLGVVFGFYLLYLLLLTRLNHELTRHFEGRPLLGVLVTGGGLFWLEFLSRIFAFESVYSYLATLLVSLLVATFLIFELLEHHAQHRLLRG